MSRDKCWHIICTTRQLIRMREFDICLTATHKTLSRDDRIFGIVC
ncbi:hypothetical protein MGSAQ_002385 [marine sediment metagenome]|uniref:Uncharacterized protein n=1 Tax=marine sediment metagenome TaxID=412755 RepID=A0A1B6NRP1_9ZZZZ